MENGTIATNEFGEELDVVKIVLNGRTTIVYWNDGTSNRSTASVNETFDPQVGFALCLLKKIFGHKVYGKKLFHRMIKQKTVALDTESVAAFEAYLNETARRYSENKSRKLEQKAKK